MVNASLEEMRLAPSGNHHQYDYYSGGDQQGWESEPPEPVEKIFQNKESANTDEHDPQD